MMLTREIRNLYAQSPKWNQLRILGEVSAQAHITQARLAQLCSLSAAMVNNYMKDLCRSGLLEYRRKSSKSVAYHLTSSGQRHLQSLRLDLLFEMESIFATAKEHLRAYIVGQVQTTLQRVVLYGSGNLAQLVFHALEMDGVRIVGVYDDNQTVRGRDFCGREILNSSQIRFAAPDAVVVADLLRTESICQSLSYLSERGIKIIRLDAKPEPGFSRLPGTRSNSVLCAQNEASVREWESI